MVLYNQIREVRPHSFEAEASTLGLPPGQWPEILETPEVGNKQPFLRIAGKRNDEGELLYVRYFQAQGCVQLYVYND